MTDLIRSPFVVLGFSFLAMWGSARIGVFLFRRRRKVLDEEVRKDLDVIVGSTLTLLGLVIGFSFSMAISRYDQRKIYEEAEANAIGTEYVRANLLPASDAAGVRKLLRTYLDQRISFYTARGNHALQRIDISTAELQNDLWSSILAPAAVQPTPMMALVVSGMNDVLNAEGYTQAAWWNRIPVGAWCLMAAVALCSNLLFGFATRRAEVGLRRLLILPFILCIAFFLIADIDSPRRGMIRVQPQDLISLAQSLQGH